MPECERIISSIEHFHGHLEIESCGKLGLCGIEYKEDLEDRKEEIKDFCELIKIHKFEFDGGKMDGHYFVSNRKKFNYRVCAIIILTAKSWQCTMNVPHTFICLVAEFRWGETAEHAVVREVEEELNITPKIIRPLWLNQSFFTEDVDKLNYHEICILLSDGHFRNRIIGKKENGLHSMKVTICMTLNGLHLNGYRMNISILYF